MRYLTLAEVVELHELMLSATGGATGVRDLGGLESALVICSPKTGPRRMSLLPLEEETRCVVDSTRSSRSSGS
jgi:hypothetical protein